jgi:hypothetical protein
MQSHVESITPFQATFIGSPHPAQLVEKSATPTWKPTAKRKYYSAEVMKTLPVFIQAVDYELRDTLARIQIPSRFDKSKLYGLIINRLSDYVESDIQLKSFIQTFEETNVGKEPATYIKTLKRYSTEVDEMASSQVAEFAYLGLKSDIPFSVFCDLSLSYFTYQKVFKYVVEVAEHRIGKLHTKGFRPWVIQGRVKIYLDELKPVMLAYIKAIESEFRLMLYVEIANSLSYEELFKPKVPSLTAMNPLVFQEYRVDFEGKLSALRVALYERAPHLFKEAIDFQSPIASLWVANAMKGLGDSTNEG